MARLFVARPTGYRMETADTGTWAMQFAFRLRDFADVTEVHFFNVSNPRILLNRNICVAQAQRIKADYLLFLDPDMVPDYYVGQDPQAKRFWDTAWSFIKQHRGAVCAAPYCGPPPDEAVHVFVRTDHGEVSRLPRAIAAQQQGWKAVEGVGTGLMLIDMAVFVRLDQPYFDDEYVDASRTDLYRSQDVQFCLKCRAKDVGIYVNFDAWALHYQPMLVHRPGWKPPVSSDQAMPNLVAPDPSIPVLMLSTRTK